MQSLSLLSNSAKPYIYGTIIMEWCVHIVQIPPHLNGESHALGPVGYDYSGSVNKLFLYTLHI